MRKHIFDQTIEGKKYEVNIGWGNTIKKYYGKVLEWVQDIDFDRGGFFDEPVWSTPYMNLQDKPITLAVIQEQLEQRGFNIPDGLLDKVEKDKHNNAVDDIRFYDAQIIQLKPSSM